MRMMGLIAVAGLSGCMDVHNPPPPDAARAWAKEMGIEVAGVQCAQTDSDRDGYVSCDLRVKGDKVEMLSLQCATELQSTFDGRVTGGCKSTQPKTTVNQTVIR